MAKQYSVAKARQDLAALIHEAETGTTVEVTRRGRPVAVLVSASRYRRLEQTRPAFWSALKEFRASDQFKEHALDTNFLSGVRDRTSGRDVKL